MFYVIETENVGPNATDARYIDSHTYRIQTCPGLLNMSREPAIDGWLGTTNDWCETAHGEFSTLEEAQAKIHEGMRQEFREFLETYWGDTREGGVPTPRIYRTTEPDWMPWETRDSHTQLDELMTKAEQADLARSLAESEEA